MFVIECYWPGVTEEMARTALARLRRAGGRAVPSRGCILVQADAIAFFLVKGPSFAEVDATVKRAGIPADRIAEAVAIDLGDQSPRRPERRRSSVSAGSRTP